MSGNWKECRLGDLFQIKHGYAFKGAHFGTEGSHIVLTPGNFFDQGGFKKKGDKEKWYSGEIPKDYILSQGDLIVAMTEQAEGLLGSSAIIPDDGLYLHNQRLGLIEDVKDADTRFLYYLFNSESVRQQIRASCSGVKVRHTSPTRIYEVKVQLPDLPTQRRIAGILSAYDDLIENNLRRISILEEMAQSLYREWFVHFRYPGHESVPLVDSPLGPIPKEWVGTTLGEFVESGSVSLQTGPFGTQLKASYYTSEGTPVINVRNIGFGTLRPEKLEHLPPDKEEELKRHKLRAGDIVFGRKGAVERHLLVGPVEDGWIQGSDCIRLRVTNGPLTPQFLSIGFREPDHHRWMLNQCSGAATMASLNQDILCRIPVVLPPAELLSKFDAFVSKVVDEVDVLASKNRTLRQTRDLLLPKLLSADSSARS